MTKHYVVNKLNTPLDLKSGYLIIPAKGYAEIHERDAEHDTILFALDRGWVDVTKDKPSTESTPVQEVKIEITEPYAGMTEEELKADQAKEAEKVAVESTDIGVDPAEAAPSTRKKAAK